MARDDGHGRLRLDEPAPAAGGAGLELMAAVGASLGKISDAVAADRGERRIRSAALRMLSPVPISGNIPLSGGAGTLVSPDTLGPHDGFQWDVRRVTAYGFTAGSVQVFLNTAQGEPLGNIPTAGVPLFFSTSLILNYRDNLVFVATGITGNAVVGGQAIQVPTPLMPEYLM